MRDAVIVEAVRTPVGKGKPGGALSSVHPVPLFAHSLRSLVDRAGIDPAVVDDVIGGTVTQIGEQAMNTTRWAWLSAGFPESVPATTIDRQCGSSQQAVHFAAQGVLSGAYDVVIAGGVESMSRVPMGSNVLPGSDPFGPGIAERYPDGLVPQGISAELIATKWDIGRTELDEFALSSHAKAATARDSGRFANEIVPLKAAQADGSIREVTADETIRTGGTLEVMAGLRPAFRSDAMSARFPRIGWHVTAGNSSPINDGSAALLITTSDKAAELGLRPRARLHTFAVVGDDPLLMLTGIIPATHKVLARAGLTVDDIDLFEVNEAFASVVLMWQRETGVPSAKVNVNGGAIAIGHPLGASGARIMTTMVNALEQRDARFGLQVMCEAGGLANATIVERL
ncbi:MAG TPA: thiolase family protein [Pseudonocardiaceae bacterium]|jgi:acetyl-CoA acyltransferase|nr:thiolase family protein [Pseudonocardiaceae bacterium]